MLKKKVDTIIRGGHVLTQDEAGRSIEGGFVAVSGDRIVALGGPEESGAFNAETVIDAAGCLVMPGLVNAHTHLPMSLFRGLADDLPLMTWLNEYIFPAEAKFINPESVRIGTLLSCAEMILSGTTCCCDGYFHEDAVAGAVVASGMRAVLGQGVIDFPAPGVPDPEKNVAHARHFAEKWLSRSPLITPSICCHSPYTCSSDTLTKAKAAANSLGIRFQIHIAETRSEVDQIRGDHGTTPVRYLEKLGILDEATILAHCVWVDPAEIRIMAERGVAVSHNPESNMKLASGIAPVPDLIAAGIPVGLGTDGCASNNNLDLFSEMDTAAKLHKVSRLDPTVMDADTVLAMATTGGAEVLGLSGEIGSLATGKKADLIVIDTKKPHLYPFYRPASHMVYAAGGSDVRDVMVNGKILLRDRQLTTLDLPEILAEAGALGAAIREKIGVYN